MPPRRGVALLGKSWGETRLRDPEELILAQNSASHQKSQSDDDDDEGSRLLRFKT